MTRKALVREPAILALVARDVCSITGSQMTWVALPWFVLTTTGSEAKMALVIASMSAGLGIVGFASGNVIARLGPRRTMLVSDAGRATATATIALLHLADLLSFPVLLGLVFVIGSFATPGVASRAAILPEIVGEDEGRLAEANALIQGAMSSGVILAPPLAGVLIGVIGVTPVLLVDAALMAAGFLLVLVVIRVGKAVPETEESRGLAAGLRFLRGDRLLRHWASAQVVSDTVSVAFFITIPVLVLTRFGDDPEIVGWIMGGFGVGSVVGSALVFRVVRRVDHLLLASLGKLAWVAPLWCFLADVPVPALVAAMVATGLAAGAVNAPLWTIFALRTPQALRAKAWASMFAASSLLQPLAMLATAPALVTVGLTPTLVGLLLVLTGAACVFSASGLRERARVAAGALPTMRYDVGQPERDVAGRGLVDYDRPEPSPSAARNA